MLTVTKFPCVPQTEIVRLVSEIGAQGFGVLKHYLSDIQINSIQNYVSRESEKHSSEYIFDHGKSVLSGSLLEKLERSEEFKSIFFRIYAEGTGQPPPT